MAPKVINVPKTDPIAYNPNRPAGKLLQAQTVHLREALIKHVHELATLLAVDVRTLKTEGDVSAYVHKATALLHTHAARPSRKPR
jgi:hypothetical protein